MTDREPWAMVCDGWSGGDMHRKVSDRHLAPGDHERILHIAVDRRDTALAAANAEIARLRGALRWMIAPEVGNQCPGGMNGLGGPGPNPGVCPPAFGDDVEPDCPGCWFAYATEKGSPDDRA